MSDERINLPCQTTVISTIKIKYLCFQYYLYHAQEIFGDQLKDNNECTTVDIWKPLNVTITVLPEEHSNCKQNNVLVNLHVKATENYPNE